MQCPTCGSRVPEDADVCPDCGMDLQAMQATAPNASLAPNASPAPSAQFEFVEETPPSAAPSAISLSKDDFDPFDFDLSEPTPALPDAAQPPTDYQSASAPDTAVATPNAAAVAPNASANSAALTLKRGGTLTAEKFVIGPMATIGRFDPESGPVDVDMANLPEAAYVSRHHAEIHCTDGQWRVKDLGSRNGTFVRAANGGTFARVNGEHPLSDGDEVSLGNARFEFRLGQ